MWKRAALAFCVAVLLLLPVTGQAAEVITGKVVHVADGDTVTVLTSGHRQIRVRLYGIDCPEKRQAYGNRARQAVVALVAGKTVQVRSMGADRYGRLLGLITGPDGGDVNRVLVQQGMAWVYTRYCKAPQCRTWQRDEADAQAARRGLWADPHAMPPWEWRRLTR